MRNRVYPFLILLSMLLIPLPSTTNGQSFDPLIDDFEGDDVNENWWFYDDGSSLDCGQSGDGFNSTSALMVAFEVQENSYPGCGRDVEADGWDSASGVQFVWRSNASATHVSVILSVDDLTQTHPEAFGTTPFEAYLITPSDQWTTVELAWSDFVKADWVGEGGVSELNPSDIVTIQFVFTSASTGMVWMDDLMLMLMTEPPVFDKFSLWTNGTQLRGANVWQRVVVPELDGLEFLGSGHVGPPYTQEDFDRLAAFGANYVNLSVPGLFTERPPYVLDEGVQAELDAMLDMAHQADLFAVISVRTGPGRSDFTFYRDGAGDWFDADLLIESVWEDQAAQDAWVEMWAYMAERYRDNPIVVGYDLMVEPNAGGVVFDIYDPDEFYSTYAGTTYDWNQFYPRIVDGIREVDADTPILVSAMGWGAVRWLPYLQPIDDPKIVYMVHQYEPQDDYTHQDPPAPNTYPGTFDINGDGQADEFNRAWLDGYLSVIDEFKANYGVPVSVNEFGIQRWVPNGAAFMRDSMMIFEERGMNYAHWVWSPSWQDYNVDVDAFDIFHGPDPNNHVNVADSELMQVVREFWERNVIRPSDVIE